MAEKKAVLTLNEKSVELPVRSGSIGPDVVDITPLYKNTHSFTYDPGFTSTASCESRITYIDGDEGVLLHRGYPIDQLAEHGDEARAIAGGHSLIPMMKLRMADVAHLVDL